MTLGSSRCNSVLTAAGSWLVAVSRMGAPRVAAAGPAARASGNDCPVARNTVSAPVGKASWLIRTLVAYRSAPAHRSTVAACTGSVAGSPHDSVRETRKVSWSATISYGGVTYSVPHTLADATVWVRVDGDQIVVTHCSASGPVEVARHRRSTPGNPMIDDAHYPPRPAGPLARKPHPTSAAEAEFLALGEGARLWLVEAASAGTSRVRVKMAEAVQLARLHGHVQVDWALGHAATYARFADGDLASILAAHPARRAAQRHRWALAATGHERMGRIRAMTAATSPVDEVVTLLRELRLPHMRRTATAWRPSTRNAGICRSRPSAARRGTRRRQP